MTIIFNDTLAVFLIVYLSFFLDNVLLTVVVPIIPDFLFSNETGQDGEAKSLSPLQRKFEGLEEDNGPLGVLLASKAFVQLAFTPVVGYLVGVVGCNIPLFLGSCNMLVATLLFAYGNTYGLLVLARALHGSSSAAVAVSSMCILAKKVSRDARFKLMPLAFGGIGLGVLVGYPLGGIAYHFLGKSAPFILIAGLLIGDIFLQVKYLKEEEMIEEVVTIQENLLQWIVLLKDKHTIIIIGAICICTSAMAILEPCVPMWLMASLNPPPKRWELGAVFIPDSIGYFLGSHFAGLLPVKSWRITLSSMVLVGLSCSAIPLAKSVAQLSLPHFCLGLSVGAVDAALVPLLAEIVDLKGGTQYGPAYALQQTAVSIAYSFGTLIGGEAIPLIGFPWLIRLVGFINLMFCPLLLELEEEKKEKLMDSLPSYSSFDHSSVSTE